MGCQRRFTRPLNGWLAGVFGVVSTFAVGGYGATPPDGSTEAATETVATASNSTADHLQPSSKKKPRPGLDGKELAKPGAEARPAGGLVETTRSVQGGANNLCASPETIGDGGTFYNTVGNTTDGLVIPAGTYKNEEAQIVMRTDRGRPLSLSLRTTVGGFFSGDRTSLSPSIDFRRGERFTSRLSWGYNDIRLAEGNFTTNLGQLRLTYSFTNEIFIQGLFQYNAVSVTDHQRLCQKYNLFHQQYHLQIRCLHPLLHWS